MWHQCSLHSDGTVFRITQGVHVEGRLTHLTERIKNLVSMSDRAKGVVPVSI